MDDWKKMKKLFKNSFDVYFYQVLFSVSLVKNFSRGKVKSDQDIEGKKKRERERKKEKRSRDERKRMVGKVVSGRSEELVFKCFLTRCSWRMKKNEIAS